MTYTITKSFTSDDFIGQYGDDFRYELADGELLTGNLLALTKQLAVS